MLIKDGCKVIPVIVPDSSNLRSVNFYLVQLNNSLSLIDAGWNNEVCWESLLQTLSTYGLQLEDITEIILTHHHLDHIGLVNKIVSRHPIPVYASPRSIPRLKRDKKFLKDRVHFYEKLYSEMGCGEMGAKQIAFLQLSIKKNKLQALQPEITEITNNKLLDFQVIEIPGHSPDQLAFWDTKRKWLFSGDLIIEHISSNALIEPDENGKRMHTLLQHRTSLQKCDSLTPEVVFSGHGNIINSPNLLFNKRIERMEQKSDNLLNIIRSKTVTPAELAQAFYKNTYVEQFSLVMSEIIGHLDYLEVQGKVKKEKKGLVWYYSTL